MNVKRLDCRSGWDSECARSVQHFCVRFTRGALEESALANDAIVWWKAEQPALLLVEKFCNVISKRLMF